MPVSPRMQRMKLLANVLKSGLFISLTLPTLVVSAQDPGNGNSRWRC